MRLAITNHGAVDASGDYALIASETGGFTVIDAVTSHGSFGVSGPASGVWTTGPIAAGVTAYADIRVAPVTAAAVKLIVMRTTGTPVDPDATNDHLELALDGVGAAPASGRWVATGNVDGAAGGEILTGTGEGERPQVRAFTGLGADTGLRFNAFEPAFRGGVRLASCDIDNDGIDEIIAGQGRGGSAVKVFRVVAGTIAEVTGFLPFEAGFTGGVYVACEDLDGDSRDDVIVGAGPGRAPDVRTFAVSSSGAVALGAWMAYEPAFTGGVRVAPARIRRGLSAGADHAGPGAPWICCGPSARARHGRGECHRAAGRLRGRRAGRCRDIDGDGGLDIAIAPDGGAPSLLRVFDDGDAVDRRCGPARLASWRAAPRHRTPQRPRPRGNS
jgi:hypothetical protein